MTLFVIIIIIIIIIRTTTTTTTTMCNTMVFEVLDNESVESTVHAIQIVHITSILGATTVQLACFKEVLSEQSF